MLQATKVRSTTWQGNAPDGEPPRFNTHKSLTKAESITARIYKTQKNQAVSI